MDDNANCEDWVGSKLPASPMRNCRGTLWNSRRAQETSVVRLGVLMLPGELMLLGTVGPLFNLWLASIIDT
jgi:hypothetical protein